MRKITQQGFDEYCQDNDERYLETMQEEFTIFANKKLKLALETFTESMEDENDRNQSFSAFTGFVDEFSKDEDFVFPGKGDWLQSEWESEYGDYVDRAYDEEKDRRMDL